MLDYIYDPLYGRIQLPNEIKQLLMTPEVQRLRDVYQLGGGVFSFPGASHKRLAHCLGVAHLVERVVNEPENDIDVKRDSEDCRYLLYAAILHDIGQGPFSHTTDSLLKELFDGKEDDKRSAAIIRGEIKTSFEDIDELKNENVKPLSEVLDDLEIERDRLAAIIEGRGYEKYYPLKAYIPQLINNRGDLDLDKIDYLIRDAHFTGVTHGAQNPDFIIKHMTVVEDGRGELAYKKSGMNWVEQIIIARLHMYEDVYFAKTKRIVEKMIERALEYLVDKKITKEKLMFLTDSDALSLINSSEDTREIFYRLRYGVLYECIQIPFTELRSNIKDYIIEVEEKGKGSEFRKYIEENVREKLRINSELDAIIDIMGPLRPKELSVIIKPEDEEEFKLTERSIIDERRYKEVQLRPLRIALYTNPKNEMKLNKDEFKKLIEDVAVTFSS